MTFDIVGADRELLDRYVESVLLRFGDGKVSFADSVTELTSTISRIARSDGTIAEHLRGLVEAGDDA
jgi:hypothetical protein